jgi:pimeloyl-ACP methyl ester carboxylesterase
MSALPWKMPNSKPAMESLCEAGGRQVTQISSHHLLPRLESFTAGIAGTSGEAHKRGYSVLLFDFRNHGESDPAHTTIGILESRDVGAASQFAGMKAPGRPQLLWGVSMGAATALLAVRDFGGFAGVISDSAFPSFRETIEHHVRLLFTFHRFRSPT